MDIDVLNLGIRKYLKKVGIRSHELMNEAVVHAAGDGSLGDRATLAVQMTIKIPGLQLDETIEGEIPLK